MAQVTILVRSAELGEIQVSGELDDVDIRSFEGEQVAARENLVATEKLLLAQVRKVRVIIQDAASSLT